MKKTTKLVTTVFCIFIGTGDIVMADNLLKGEQNVLILDAEPESSDDVLKTVDITSKEKTLGGNDEFKIVDGKVSVLKPLVYKLTKPEETPLGQDSKNSRFYLVQFRFTLHPPETKRRYENMRLRVKLSNPNITTLKLIPTSVTTEADVNQSFDLGFSIGIPETKIGANAKQTVAFKRLLPTVVAYSYSDSDFYWEYSQAPGANTVESGEKTVATVIQVPDSVQSLSATIDWKVKLTRSFLGEWRDVPVSVEPITMNLPLL